MPIPRLTFLTETFNSNHQVILKYPYVESKMAKVFQLPYCFQEMTEFSDIGQTHCSLDI